MEESTRPTRLKGQFGHATLSGLEGHHRRHGCGVGRPRPVDLVNPFIASATSVLPDPLNVDVVEENVVAQAAFKLKLNAEEFVRYSSLSSTMVYSFHSFRPRRCPRERRGVCGRQIRESTVHPTEVPIVAAIARHTDAQPVVRLRGFRRCPCAHRPTCSSRGSRSCRSCP